MGSLLFIIFKPITSLPMYMLLGDGHTKIDLTSITGAAKIGSGLSDLPSASMCLAARAKIASTTILIDLHV